MVPSSGGGTKLMRTLLVGDAEGVCSGVDEGVGLGVSCANATQADARAIRMTALTFFIMSVGIEKSLVVGHEEAEET